MLALGTCVCMLIFCAVDALLTPFDRTGDLVELGGNIGEIVCVGVAAFGLIIFGYCIAVPFIKGVCGDLFITSGKVTEPVVVETLI